MKGSECTLTIKEMLQAGKTPQDLIKEINDAQKEINAEKNKREEVKNKFIQAAINYYRAVHGREPEPEFVGQFVDRIEEAEKKGLKDKKENKPNTDDEILRKFLDSLWMLEDKIW